MNPEEKKSHPGKRILIMDDEDYVRSSLSKILNEMGYQTEVVSTGEEAIEVFKISYSRGEVISFLLLDLTIKGGIGATETLKAIKLIDKNVKAILLTGSSNSSVLSEYRKFGFSGAIAKPFKIKKLIKELKSSNV